MGGELSSSGDRRLRPLNAWTISLGSLLALLIGAFAAWFTITDYVDKTVTREITAAKSVWAVQDENRTQQLKDINRQLEIISAKIDDLLKQSHTHGP